ncbi:3-dehydroquinate dehydratase [Campylobacter ureolyticus RIGS 9880]|jgi:3-dehydroquinate dehydratase, type II|uniref:3-dehydroquinate dehydratase n=2 Tax=Campylobacter ureolyticus TaxID=827 RepID=A0A2I1NC24_9BACT|nr:type II 3-dehydroquinate dehydratase [Campylobacter ureolyticus]AKT90169.1 3-dehydroquinate dehydratase [Campylobacter ureolyticus RIGS 9880]MCR8684151.1 type II 3-dehydroquinate dehydratase [Campylobacter ureolyticus]MCZ6103312.1 type II 3-dehydroquinate dehydratase [Campylobacter ureolyticus]MCZ6117436.1 type II 3-dehydroquinate dehydratase [Campylobacter ureolyticus]MCZ6134512.1 type II 3-dehydroquinate dehydratase [Campylobacter ureolyticus]
MKVVIIQGPNINMLGKREPNVYGVMTMEEIHKQMKVVADQNNVDIEFFQSNLEGEIIDKIQECLGDADGIIINPAGYSHTSVAIRDAIAAVNLPTIEVHISNIARREEFRQKSLISAVTAGQVIGFGPIGYHLAMIAMLQIFSQIEAVKKAKENTQKTDE